MHRDVALNDQKWDGAVSGSLPRDCDERANFRFNSGAEARSRVEGAADY